MDWYFYVIIAVMAICFLIITNLRAKHDWKRKMKNSIKKQWGNFSEREYTAEEYKRISYFSEYMDAKPSLMERFGLKNRNSLVDDITWNDLNTDDIFQMINTTNSSAGEEVFYFLLRHPFQDMETFLKRKELLEKLGESEERALKLKEIFYQLGRTKSISFCEFITRLEDLKNLKNTKSFFCLGALILSILMLFLAPAIGILLITACVIANVFFYYTLKAEVESYFINFHYISRLVRLSETFGEIWNEEGLAEVVHDGFIDGASETEGKLLFDKISGLSKKLKDLANGDKFLEKKSMGDSISGLIMDYVKMLTHVDLISFKRMAKKANAAKEEILELFYFMGYAESCLTAVSFRKSLYFYCVPELDESSKSQSLEVKEIYHPLIYEPVCNDISTDGSVLLTGSNASGKSTFLKTVALNAILAQTICTVTGSYYAAPFYHVYSSMALRDNITGGESYFIVEIKSLKRVLDSIAEGKNVLCFVDEVLRGTNTVERIAASTEILKGIAENGACCFAATHDIELTKLLAYSYHNYHFREQIVDGQVVFDYQLRTGPAVTRNAIKLLRALDYPEKYVKNAEESAEFFLKNGQWT